MESNLWTTTRLLPQITIEKVLDSCVHFCHLTFRIFFETFCATVFFV